MRLALEAISRFAHSMAACLNAALPVAKALDLSGQVSGSVRIRRAAAAAAAQCARGTSLTDALQTTERAFPKFFLPVVRAGEVVGRQVEAFQLVHEHGARMLPTMRLARQAWLYPLICVVAGWVARIALFIGFGLGMAAWQLAQGILLEGAVVVVGVGLLLRLAPVKAALDTLLLHIPWFGSIQVRLGLVLFFSTLRLVYETGGTSALGMFDLALATVSNTALRKDLSLARAVLEENGSWEEAFSEPTLIDDAHKGTLATGAISGHLASSLEHIVKIEAVELDTRLEVFNRIFQRLIAFGVGLSIVGTLLVCLASVPGR